MSNSTLVWRQRLGAITIAALAVGAASAVQAADSISAALTGGKVSLDMRFRAENVSDDNTATGDATALTVRTRLGYTTGSFNDFSAMLEAENVALIGDENYNSSVNGNTQYSTILDPDTTEMNQAYLSFAGLSDTVMNLGRQRITLDNHRFIGNSGWRQNEQTYDGFSLVNKSLSDTTLTYAFLSNVNRVVGNESTVGDARMSSHALNANYAGLGIGTLTGYGYLLDYDATTSSGSDTQTWGLRFAGGTDLNDSTKLLYTAEYARQSDYADNTTSYDVDYLLGEIGASFSGITAKYGYEQLGSDGTKSVQTPLATLHAFNGWADMFLSTPATTGLVDQYVSVGGKLMDINLAGVYHDFAADSGGTDYGTEWDLMANQTINKIYTVGLKYATFSADSASSYVDTDKVWVWGEVKF